MNNYQTDKVRASLHFELKQDKYITGKVKPESILIKARLQNYCDENLECWCNMKISSSILKDLEIKGFYNGEHSFDLQPFERGTGWFKIVQHILNDKKMYKKFRKVAKKPAMKKLLYFTVNFSYNIFEEKEKIKNVPHKMYYDFNRNKLVADY